MKKILLIVTGLIFLLALTGCTDEENHCEQRQEVSQSIIQPTVQQIPVITQQPVVVQEKSGLMDYMMLNALLNNNNNRPIVNHYHSSPTIKNTTIIKNKTSRIINVKKSYSSRPTYFRSSSTFRSYSRPRYRR